MNIQEIRKRIAVEHETLLGENDPILMLATLQEEILRQSLDELDARIEAQDEKFKKKLTDALDVTVQRSVRIGENIVKSSAELIGKRAESAFDEALQKAINQIQRDIALAQKKEQAKIGAFWYGWGAASVFTLLFVAALRWMGTL